MKSMEFIQSIDWPEWGPPGRMRPIASEQRHSPHGQAALPGLSNRSRHARYWTEISAVFPHGRGFERPGEGIPAVRPGHAPGQVARSLLLAEGLHVRVP